MKLLILLVCLGLERFLHAGTFLYRFSWFGWYVEKCHKFLEATSTWRSYLEIVVIVLPVSVVVGAIYYTSCYWLHGAFQFVIGTIVLLYCLGPEDIYREKEQSSQTIFEQANENLFAVVFWFALFGPIAAVLYRAVALLSRVAYQAEYTNLISPADTVLAVFNWLPVRFFGLCFALVGNFVKTFSYWLDTVMTGWSKNRDVIENCGRLAQGLEIDASLTAETVSATFGLIDRTLIVFIVVVVAFFLGSWL